MAKDTRRILLTDSELVAAFDGYRRVTPGFLAAGKITRCVPSSAGTVTATLQTRNGDELKTTDFVFTAEEILPLMIRFCIQNHIMLPRAGHKFVALSDSAVMIGIELDLDLGLVDDVVFFDEPGSLESALTA